MPITSTPIIENAHIRKRKSLRLNKSIGDKDAFFRLVLKLPILNLAIFNTPPNFYTVYYNTLIKTLQSFLFCGILYKMR